MRNETGADIQSIRQKFFQLERHRIDRTISRFLSGFVGHFGADAIVRTGRSGWLSALAPTENLG
jgi:RNA:NAD 2'-phosphotransferase (TPT1/KptA family)